MMSKNPINSVCIVCKIECNLHFVVSLRGSFINSNSV